MGRVPGLTDASVAIPNPTDQIGATRQYDVEKEFERLRVEVTALETAHPDQVVQVLVAPISVAVSSGNRAPGLGKAVLRRMILKRGSKELWVELGQGTPHLSGAKPWTPARMQVAVTGLVRDAQWPLVVFTAVDH
ncbi:hypothetical protein [Burkholderia vietnamiensis]|uniref:hypothetical protein n=1 Tax=Burkholderia vietnamiensis TaxID=60552 RepID=UPI00158A3821|nr:hypothetical protein [Burkholderia vietnamiensis]